MDSVTSSKDSSGTTSYADDPINRDLTKEDKIRFLREMLRIRRFEEVSLKYYQGGNVGGFLHLYIGQESIAVATASMMGDHDHIITAYRDHGHALAVGMTMNECMAELFGRKTGCSKGRGGSMHYFAPDKNYWGGHGIVGGQTPLGLGIAYALKYKGLKGSCMCFLGDGAVNQGAYHESLNLAGLWDIPVIYIIENNGYSMGTSQVRSSAYPEYLAKRAEGYNIAWDTFTGENIYEVRAGLKRAIDRAHNEGKPTVLEIATYRWRGHSVADANAEKYRTKEEIQRYMENHDPVTIWKNVLIEEGVINEDDFKQISDDARKEANDSATFAKQSEYLDPSQITEDVYWEVDNDTEAGQTGKHFFND